jgi:uncharacterized OB-fold protein
MKNSDEGHRFEGALPFREGLFSLNQDGTGYLLANRCQRCGLTFFPSRQYCIECYKSDDLREIKLATEGILHTFTIVHRATPDFKTPYAVGYIDFKKDGVRIFAPIVGCKPEDLKIGMKMELVFGEINKVSIDGKDKNRLIYQFRPMKES